VLGAALTRVDGLRIPAGAKDSLCEAIEATRVSLARPFAPVRCATLHRDLHPGQVHCGPRTGLLDVDDLACGEPELDLGNLAAHLLLDDLQRWGELQEAAKRTSAFLEGYSYRDIDPVRFDLHCRAALLRLATLERVAAPFVGVLGHADMVAALLRAAAIV
jgi:hypothetical protein